MPKSSSDLIKKTVNNLLDFISQSSEIPMILPAERVLSGKFEVSRSTLIQAFNDLEQKKIVRQESRSRLVLRYPNQKDYYNQVSKVSTKTENVENFILEKFSKRELKPGDRFSELQIAREIDANTVTVREVLLKISSTGLIKKKPRKQWEVISITGQTVDQITEYRQLLELEGLKHLLKFHPDQDHINQIYQPLLKKHQELARDKNIDRLRIVALESDFHKGLVAHTENKFIEDNYESLFFVIRYHLGQHNMTQTRFRSVLAEHLDVIQSILELDYKKSVTALKKHFKESKRFFFLANELSLEKQKSDLEKLKVQ
ncbi:MAG: GntR family transcriptional regulator [Candidatus Cyclobacteriaceae bacterium M3_2C_046]